MFKKFEIQGSLINIHSQDHYIINKPLNINKKPLILIVDDTPRNIQVLGNILYSKGYNVSISSSGAHALQTVNTNLPDLILLDVQMPEMDGYEVCKELKLKPKTKDIPVIFLTAKVETKDLLHGFKVGAVDYITKPFNVAELTARIANHLELKKSKEDIKTLNVKLQNTNNKLNEAYNDIKNSIHYAKRIQESILPNLKFLAGKGIDHFLIFKPKDIVNGDFYWVEQVIEKTYIVVADCTGHGVPGALLSMLGHNMLNEIIKIENIFDPSEILYNLNDRFRSILKQEIDLSHDGMDLALCVIDNKTKIVEFAGAKRSIYYSSKGRLKEIKPNKSSIGGLESNNSVFSKQIFKLTSGDRIFMFTDGITDQFDSRNNKKLTRKRFMNQISLLMDHPLNIMKNELLEFLKKWQGSNYQTDDILVVGIEIS
ncbi:MAG: response regulator [Bacteroidota bacterium]